MTTESVADLLDKLLKVQEELNESIREAHSTLKALKQERKQAEKISKELDDIIKDLIDKYTAEHLKIMLDEVAAEIQENLSSTAAHVMKEFNKVSDPLMRSIEEMKMFGATLDADLKQAKKDFFNGL